MKDEQVYRVMVIIAVATPTLALFLHFFAGRAGIVVIQKGRLVILVIAGPANLVLWLVFNKYLDGVGNNSIFGIVLAAMVFVGMGYGLGIWRGRRPLDEKDRAGVDAVGIADVDKIEDD